MHTGRLDSWQSVLIRVDCAKTHLPLHFGPVTAT